MVEHVRSSTVYRILIYTNVLLEDFIMNHPNCICSSRNKWMVMYHNVEYSMKMSIAKGTRQPGIIILFFTKLTSIEHFFPEFQRLFGSTPIPSNITLVNIVEKYYCPVSNIYFDGVYDELDKNDDIMVTMSKRRSVTPSYPKILKYSIQEKKEEHDMTSLNDDDGKDPQLSMDLQRFCALKIRPFPLESKVTIEVFDSGVLNVAGINPASMLDKVTKYINDTLLPILVDNSNI